MLNPGNSAGLPDGDEAMSYGYLGLYYFARDFRVVFMCFHQFSLGLPLIFFFLRLGGGRPPLRLMQIDANTKSRTSPMSVNNYLAGMSGANLQEGLGLIPL